MRALLGLLLVGCGGGGASAGKDSATFCTEIGCSDGFFGSFSPILTGEGAFVITLTAGDRVATCTATLPFAEGEGVCDDPSLLTVTFSGTLLGVEDQAIPDFQAPSSPEAFTVVVTRDGVEIGRQDFEPAYEVSYPNGEDCPPECWQASGQVVVTL
jgi:hypothetical protein